MENIEVKVLEDLVAKVAERVQKEIIEAILNALHGYGEPEEKGEPLDITTAWDRKEARENRRAVERETASRFRQCRARETAWAARKRTSQRQREWRGPWRPAK